MVAALKPDWVLNGGAYTAVDRAEEQPQLAEAVNAAAPRAFAEALAELGSGRLLQISTDFVFSGQQGHPYGAEDKAAPLGVYGASKARGEAAVLEVLGPKRACVLRTSWLYGPVGKNFCLTMLRLHEIRAKAGEQLGVVADQVGCPTHTAGLAAACWQVLAKDIGGMQQWSDAGVASWYDFAVAIGEEAVALGILATAAKVNPISTAEYPTQAQRPSYSLMDCSASRKALGLEPLHWRQGLRKVLKLIEPGST
ncbi:MAG: dTDP-4-dehydrorhamnose reductase, partial [Synechococcaceae bacterium WBB_34_004]|nr:dTDP-4-dehydrorhamnose reductase [Synechococcaceae bacterium WBB_34_004]